MGAVWGDEGGCGPVDGSGGDDYVDVDDHHELAAEVRNKWLHNSNLFF